MEKGTLLTKVPLTKLKERNDVGYQKTEGGGMEKQELKELTVSIFERLREAIKKGDDEKALALNR